LEDLRAGDRLLVTTAGEALGAVQRGEHGFKVGQGQFGVDRVDVARRVDASFDMQDVSALEAADDVKNRVDLADVGQELVAQPLTAAGPADDTGDVDDADGGGDDLFTLDELLDDVEPLVGNGDNADVRF